MTTLTIEAIGVSVSGKGAAKRTAGWLALAASAFNSESSRAGLVANVQAALGIAPTDAEKDKAKREYVIGIAAFKMPVSELPKGKTSDEARLEFARELVCHYASPPEDGKEARPLRANQKGRRSPGAHKVIRNAEKNWSTILGEAGLGSAQSVADKNAKARAPQMAGSTERGKAKDDKATPTHAQLVVPAAPLNSDEYVHHMVLQLNALGAFDKKHAAKRPTPFGKFAEDLMGLIRTANAAASEYQLNKDKAAALAAEKKAA